MPDYFIIIMVVLLLIGVIALYFLAGDLAMTVVGMIFLILGIVSVFIGQQAHKKNPETKPFLDLRLVGIVLGIISFNMIFIGSYV